jgi:hypothetical protein
MIGAGAIIGGALILLGYLFRPDAIPGYSGVLSPKATLLFSAKNAEAPIVPKLQFGTSGVMYGAKERAGSVCLSSFSGLISGMPAGFRPPRSATAG